jgi:hypothetical protein
MEIKRTGKGIFRHHFKRQVLGACIDYDARVSFVRKLLAELARDPDSGKLNDDPPGLVHRE